MALALLRAGHERLVLLSGDPGIADPVAFPRQVWDGCADAVEGLSTGTVECARARTPEEAYETGMELLTGGSSLERTAVIGSDEALLGLYKAAYEVGLSIPRDLSVVGIDGIARGAYYAPALTTVDVRVGELGRRAADILAESILSGKQRRGLEITPVELIERESARLVRATAGE